MSNNTDYVPGQGTAGTAAEDRKVVLSARDVEVKFRVRGRILTAIRGITLDIYENESIAIVGESGSGKSVFTKTFAGMLDSNGFISNGSIIFDDPELADTKVSKNGTSSIFTDAKAKLDAWAPLAAGAGAFKAMQALKDEKREKSTLSDAENEKIRKEIDDLKFRRTETFNQKQTFDPGKEKDKIKEADELIAKLDAEVKAVEARREALIKEHKAAVENDTAYQTAYNEKMAALESEYKQLISAPASEAQKTLNEVIAKEICLSVGRFGFLKRRKAAKEILENCRKAYELGVDLTDAEERARVLGGSQLYVRYLDETADELHGETEMDLAKISFGKDWSKIRGTKIATVFQDPMTSLNPVLTIGNQIVSIILKHQDCSEGEARIRAIELMKKVGIPNAENRFDDYPFQYSGGMRQRIVIAIALSCQPKILICDEPTTALDVTIQAQILQLLKDLQREYNYTIVFITHDLGVVANVADRVAVLYAGQMIELGTVEDVFYDPRHPYTWALLSSLPQLAEKGTKLYSITGTPPSLYNKITGDAFAPRNPYCMKIDTIEEPLMFKVSETHYAKTWLMDPRSPQVEKPAIIQNIHQKLLKTYHLEENA